MKIKQSIIDTRLTLEELEPRQLFSGGLEGVLLADTETESTVYLDIDEGPGSGSALVADIQSSESTVTAGRQELVFIDTGVENYQELLNDILAQDGVERDIEVVLFDNQRDGIEQISAVLAGYQNLGAVHLISHGSEGSVDIGNTRLDLDGLTENRASISIWSDSFSEDGDFLIYGCNLAATEDGQSLINALSALTQADVAASDDLTGHASLGGDWELEVATGQIETAVVFSAQVQQVWSGVLADGDTSVSFQEGVSGYAGTQDTELESNNPDTDWQNATLVSVDLQNTLLGESHGLIKFDNLFGNGSGQIPVGATIISAELTFNVNNSATSTSTISLYRMLTSWTEGSTWNSTSSGIQTDDLEASSTADTIVSDASATGFVAVSGLENTLQAWSDGANNDGWVIKTDSTDGWIFDSSENGTTSLRPKLTVEYRTTGGDIATGLVGHWTFDADASDSAGANDGSLTNGASIDTANNTNYVGVAKLSLDGTNDYVDLSAHVSSFENLTEGTISAWIKTTGTDGTVFSISDSGDTDSGSTLLIDVSGQLEFNVFNNGSALLELRSTKAIDDGVWHHVVVTVNSSGNTIYIDGEVASVTYDTGNPSATTFFDDIGSLDSLNIGRGENDSGGRLYFDGLMDDVRLHNQALSVADIAALAAEAPVAFNDAATTNKNTPVVIDLTANDTDLDNESITVLDVSNPTNGTVVNNNDGTVTYTPNTNYTGTDSFNYVTADLDDTVSYWRLDGNATDSVGSNHGAITGTTTVTGHYGNALSFDEVDDNVVISDLALNDEFSVSIRFKVDDNTGSDFQYLYSHGAFETQNSLNVLIGEASSGGDSNKLITRIHDNNDATGVGSLEADIASLIGDGQWHTYTLTVTSGLGSKMYIDGVLHATDLTRGGDSFNPTTDVYFGAREDFDIDRFYGGSLDSVQIFNRGLSAEEVSDVHTGGSSLATVQVTVNGAPTDIESTQFIGGDEFIVNTTTADYQNHPSVAALSDDGFVIVWESRAQDGSGDGIYGQRYDVNNNPVGAEFQVNTYTTGNQQSPVVTTLANGNFVVTWESDGQDGSNFGIYGQMFDTGGNPLGGEFQVNTTTGDIQTDPRIAALDGGGFVIVWESNLQDGDQKGIYSQSFDASGSPIGTETLINTTTSGNQVDPRITSLNGGGYIVLWDSEATGSYELMAQSFDAVGNTVGSEFQVNTVITNTQDNGAATALTGGGFVVAWESDNQDGSVGGLFGQLYDASNNPVGGEFQVNTATADIQKDPHITAMTDGSFVVSWESNLQDGSLYGVYAQQFDASGNKIGGEVQLNTTTADNQNNPALAVLNDGRLVAVWDSDNQDGSNAAVVGRVFKLGVDENASNGTTAALVTSVTDSDVGDTHTFNLIDDAGGAFSINSATGEITVLDSSLIDYETASTMNVTVRVTDSGSLSYDEVVTIYINDVNELPIASNDSGAGFSTNEDVGFTTGNVLTNDVLGDPTTTITAFDGTSANGGTVTYNNDGTFTYTPAANFNGSDTFTYTITDNDGETSTATVTITVTAVNDVPVAVDDRSGLTFDGVDDFVQFGSDPSLEMSNTMTMEAWIQPTSFPASNESIIINKEGEYEVGLFPDGSIRWGFSNADPGWAWYDTGHIVTLNEWTHVGISYNNGTVITYVNGSAVDTYNGSGSIGDTHSALDDLRIGGRQNNPTNQVFEGSIGEVRIWNTVRTAGEISTNYDLLLAGNELGLVGNWRLREGSGTSVTDISSSGNDGTLGGGTASQEPTWVGYSTDQDTTLNIAAGGVLGNDFDAENDALTVTRINGSVANVGSQITLSSGALVILNANGSFTYDPNGQFDSLTASEQTSDQFVYTADDANGGSDTATVYITITGVNDAPTASNKTVTTNEDTDYTFTATDFTFADVDGDTLASIEITTLESVGSLKLNGVDVTLNQVITKADIDSGLLKFTPVGDANGTGHDSFGFTVNDGALDSSPANTMTVDVTAVNDVPVATANTVTTTEDNAYTFSTGDFTFTDVESDSLVSITLTNQSLAGGTLELSGVTVNNGDTILAASIANLVYTPLGNANGLPLATFDFTVNDAGTGVVSAQMDIDVSAVNDVPTAANNTVATNEDTTYTYTLSDFNFADIDGDSLTQVQITNLESVGSLQLSGIDVTLNQVIGVADITAGNLKFIPVAEANGTSYDSFDFKVHDGTAYSISSYTLTVNVAAVNDVPVITNLGGDTLAYTEGDGARVIDQSTNAAVTDVDSANFDSGTLTVFFTAGSDASEDRLTIHNQGNGAGQIGISGFNVTYAGTLIGTFAGGSSGTNLVITLNSNADASATSALVRNITYENTDTNNPLAGSRTVRYVLTDGDGGTSIDYDTTVSVSAVNDDPTNAGSLPTDINVTEDVSSNINLSTIDIRDVDAGGGNLSVTLTTSMGGNLSAISAGGVTVGGTGTGILILTGNQTNLNTFLNTASNVTYLHGISNTNGSNADTIQVTVTDNGNNGLGGGGNINFGAINIDITAVNDVPSGSDKTVTTNEDTDYTFVATDFNFADVDGDTLASVEITTLESIGALKLNGVDVALNQVITKVDIDSGLLQFTPVANANGASYDSFGFTVNDGALNSSPANTMTVDVVAVNDEPTASNKTVTTNEDTDYTFTAADFNFADVDGDTLASIEITTLESVGTLKLNGVDVTLNQVITKVDIDSGLLKFTPIGNANGLSYDSFGFIVNDGALNSSPANTMTLNVTAVNDAPIATNDTYLVYKDTVFTTILGKNDLLQNDNDLDGDTFTVNTTPITGPSNGTLVLNANGTFTYTPRANYIGGDSFIYEVSDGNGGTAIATVTLTVNPVNQAPNLVDAAFVLDALASNGVVVGQVFGIDPDPGDYLSYRIVGGDGTFVIDSLGRIRLADNSNLAPYSSPVLSLTIEVADSNGLIDMATVTIQVLPGTGIPDSVIDPDIGPGENEEPDPNVSPRDPDKPEERSGITEMIDKIAFENEEQMNVSETVGISDQAMWDLSERNDSDAGKNKGLSDRRSTLVSGFHEKNQFIQDADPTDEIGDLDEVLDEGSELWYQIEQMEQQINDSYTDESDDEKTTLKIAIAGTLSFTAGFVSWVLRGGSLMASFLSSVPLFKSFDPLPILSGKQKKREMTVKDAGKEEMVDRTGDHVVEKLFEEPNHAEKNDQKSNE